MEEFAKRHPYSAPDGSSIYVEAIERHRNGVGGMGFFVLTFRDTFWATRLVGLVTDGADEDGDNSQVFVINPENYADCYRGADWYGPALRAAVADWNVERDDMLGAMARTTR